jgi:hypothetical protein
MKAKFIEHNVIWKVSEGPYGLDPHDEWTGTVREEYNKKYPNTKIITDTNDSRILKVGDWAEYFYIIGKAKNES